MNAVTETTPAQAVTGIEIFVPLNKLKKSPRNARKVPHGEAAIEALAASIHHKGLIQNLVVEPEVKADGTPTGCYLVTAGEGRRQAQLLRVKRKQIRKNEPIRCWLDTSNDPSEISLDENITRTAMHPADQFERFHELSCHRGWGAEEIGARFGVSPEIVKRRLRLGAVSPRLMDIYRQDGLTLDQLAAFAITDDHTRQEQVFANLSYNKEPWIIRRDLTADKVPAHDRRAIFVGADAYVEAGGHIVRDLFTEDDGGYFDDAALLDLLVAEKLREIAAGALAEGWKWAEASTDFPHDHGMRRYYPQTVALSDTDEARLQEAAHEYDALIEGFSSFEDMTDDDRSRAEALDAEIDTISAKRSAYDAEVIGRGGVFVCLGSNGMARIERGFVKSEDESQPEAEAMEPDQDEQDGIDPDTDQEDAEANEDEDEEADSGKPLSDTLVRDLTAHRTLGLRLALGEQPDMAMIALTHGMVSDLFYHGRANSCLEVRVLSEPLGGHADGIGETAAAEALDARHDAWGAKLPVDAEDLWACIATMDSQSRTELLAHCVSLTVNAVKLPWDRSMSRIAAAGVMAGAVDLDMTRHWTPTTRSYFGRVTKEHIALAVREAVSPEAAERIQPMKKADMADAAEQLVSGTGWLPALLRTKASPEPEADTDMVDEVLSEAQTAYIEAEDSGDDAYAIAAE
ncbi:MAG: ParB/RepB/Spo0J family partition protein [Novosphingobium sp.]